MTVEQQGNELISIRESIQEHEVLLSPEGPPTCSAPSGDECCNVFCPVHSSFGTDPSTRNESYLSELIDTNLNNRKINTLPSPVPPMRAEPEGEECSPFVSPILSSVSALSSPQDVSLSAGGVKSSKYYKKLFRSLPTAAYAWPAFCENINTDDINFVRFFHNHNVFSSEDQ